MVEKARPNQLKGSSVWALSYAIMSLRNYKVRNMGIALVLAIGVALPTTVFVWADTGTKMVVRDYFEESTYQMSMELKPTAPYDIRDLEQLIIDAENHPFVQYMHRVISTAAVFANETIPAWTSYDLNGLNYALGLKDTRAILTNNDILANWSREFDFEGNFSLSPGQILVSQGFIDYTEQVHGIVLEIGDEFDLDLIVHEPRNTGRTPRQFMYVETQGNLTIAGIYEAKLGRSEITDAFPNIMRLNWDPMALARDPVLGLDDSVMILNEDVGEELAL
ncbi:MAG: hypothetical protein P1Q69_08400, partial [Candidatus Thorarchaeota archaeon]|nr:hypothetical protein [Candidatus Thorarchaeota archaeon]